MAGLPHAVEHGSAPGTGGRLRRKAGLLVGRLVHVPLRAVSPRKFWHSALENGLYPARPGLGTVCRRRIPERGVGKPDAEGGKAGGALQEIKERGTGRERTRS